LTQSKKFALIIDLPPEAALLKRVHMKTKLVLLLMVLVFKGCSTTTNSGGLQSEPQLFAACQGPDFDQEPDNRMKTSRREDCLSLQQDIENQDCKKDGRKGSSPPGHTCYQIQDICEIKPEKVDVRCGRFRGFSYRLVTSNCAKWGLCGTPAKLEKPHM
jgi:hypothetical protein